MAVDETASPQRERAELEAVKKALAACEAENKSLRARQAASAEVLKATSASPDDARPVLELIVRHAQTLCNAQVAHYVEYDGTLLHQRAVAGYDRDPEALARFLSNFPRPAGPETVPGRVVLAGQPVHIPDIQNDPVVFRPGRGLGARSYYAVPLLHDARIIGVLVLGRYDPGEYDQSAIQLVQAFAAQAVIALSSAVSLRALRERSADLQESLEYQTAISDVLKVISRSTFDLQPVLETLLNAAARLCDADTGGVATVEGDGVRVATHYSRDGSYSASTRGQLLPLTRATIHGRTVLDGRIVHVEDITADPEHVSPDSKLAPPEGTMLGVPLLRDGVVLGSIRLARDTVRPFTARQIELVSTFADQAVIAMENARLLTEQREALERQTATAEVLQVINASPGNLAPVFEAMLDKAMRLCGIAFGLLRDFDGTQLRTLATRGLPAAYAEHVAGQPTTIAPLGAVEQALTSLRPFHRLDVRESEGYRDGNPDVCAIADLGGARTSLHVPLVKDGAAIGLFTVYRQEVLAFSDKQIALLEGFADQAVIAMENARLLTEQREALERQTATAEVLQVINASPGDLRPVFDAIVEKSLRLLDASAGGLYTVDGERWQTAATSGLPAEYAEYRAKSFPTSRNLPGIMVLQSKRPVHILDRKELEDYRAGLPDARAIVELGGIRSMLMVPLIKDATVMGIVTIYRQQVRAFTDKQIALLESFAAQAVIAMENARLLTEQREALERQTATAEVLQVINASPGNLAPVFEAMLDKAMRLCGIAFGLLRDFDGEVLRLLASRGVPAPFADFLETRDLWRPIGTMGEALTSRRAYQTLDMQDDPGYVEGSSGVRAIVDLGGARTLLHVPLVKDDGSIGLFTFFRQEVRAFSDKEIALLESFAAQAVIAMENARLLTEQREALARQTAMTDILAAINANPGNPQPAFDTILARAHEMCGADLGSLLLHEPGGFRGVATLGYPPAVAAALRETNPFLDVSSVRALRDGARYSTRADVKVQGQHLTNPVQEAVNLRSDVRTSMMIPLRREGALIGILTAHRREVRPYTEPEIALLEAFAAQAVIAIENARLLGELRARDEDNRRLIARQAASIEVLKTISASPDDPQPVFELIARHVFELCEASAVVVIEFDGALMHHRAIYGYTPEAEAGVRAAYPRAPGRETVPGRSVLAREPVQVANLQDDPELFAPAKGLGSKTILCVPIMLEGAVIGTICPGRREERMFDAGEIALLQSFAEQAAIAIASAKAQRALRSRTDELAKSQEELRITFENMNDGVALFDEHHRLVAWNANFLRILDLPEGTLAQGLSFADYIRTLAERGEYGDGADVEEQVRRVLALAGQRRSFERGRPGGRTVEIRNNPVADGGFVLIYADITERKRAEAEIAAARDAAEQAARTIEAAYRDLKIAQANLIQAEKMASLGQLTAGIAHEIKNPLNFVNNFSALSTELIDELRAVLAPQPLGGAARAEVDELTGMLRGNLEKVVQHGKRADGIVKSMLEHSRGSSTERRAVDVNALVEEALNLAYHGARAQDQSFNIALERAYADDLAPIELNPQDITRVLLNLFGNGFYAANKRARDKPRPGFSPVLTVATRDEAGAVEIRVRDNGVGVPPEIREKLFQPFFTTKPTGEGTGLGLSISWDIVTKQHGGTITVDSAVDDFTEFTVTLPRSSAGAPA